MWIGLSIRRSSTTIYPNMKYLILTQSQIEQIIAHARAEVALKL